MAFLEIKQACKGFGEGLNRTEVLSDINLTVQEGEFIAILGFSGSGKSTLINLLAGLLPADSGEVLKEGQPIVAPGPDRGVVFQNYSLLPWLSVRDNLALAVDQVFPQESKKERLARADRYIEMVGLSHATDRKPGELSGGMRQRVSVARALAMSPDILLLDEPLSALDALTRANLQNEIARIWAQEKKTVILITNDVDESLILADRIIPLLPGPKATLGKEFKNPLPRPRDQKIINDDPTFKKMRAEITSYLNAAGQQQHIEHNSNNSLPEVLPNTNKHHLDAGAFADVALRRKVDPKYLEFFKVSKIYPTSKGPLTVVEDFNLKIKQGEFISVIGHSGCGKSTVLSMAAGLTSINGGGIILDNKEIDIAGPDRGVVFQAPCLFPWMTAYQNVHLGVDQVYPHVSPAERKDIVTYYLERVGLAEHIHKNAAEMSNGMRQRVGIARAFALSPKLLLLDEPFGMLDSLTRMELQDVLMEVWNRTRVTGIMITHDVDEAIRLSDRVVMMTNGPNATVGQVLEINLPRPRLRAELLESPEYYQYRAQLIQFLEDCDHPSSVA